MPHHACLLHSEMKTQQPLHVATPVRQSLALTKVAATSVYLKLDSSQPTGSFKIRGIGHLCKTVSNPPCSGMMGLVCAWRLARKRVPVRTQADLLFFLFLLLVVGRARMQTVCLLLRWDHRTPNLSDTKYFLSVFQFVCMKASHSVLDSFGPDRRKRWNGSSIFCPSARDSCNYCRSKCYTEPNGGEVKGRGRHCNHSWQGQLISLRFSSFLCYFKLFSF